MVQRDQAIEIARQRAAEQGWSFVEPLCVTTRRGWRGTVKCFDIETHAGHRGAKARFVIDANTGEIISEGYIAR